MKTGKSKLDAGGTPSTRKDAKVHCSFDKMMPIDELKPNRKNPNTHPAEQVQLLARIITASGWRHPIVVSKRSGLIVAGHGRLLAAQAAGLKVAPVNMQHFETDAQEVEFLLADNRIAELAETDSATLAGLLKACPEIDGIATGYTEKELETLLTSNPAADLAETLAGIEEYTPMEEAERAAEKIKERIDALLVRDPSAFTRAQAVIVSDSTNSAVIIADPGLKDFLDELTRYSEAGEASPLQAILAEVHPL